MLNEYGEKNNLKVTDDEVRAEIQKQIKSMPGQEKMVIDYYQKIQAASAKFERFFMRRKLLNLIKSKIKLTFKERKNLKKQKRL